MAEQLRNTWPGCCRRWRWPGSTAARPSSTSPRPNAPSCERRQPTWCAGPAPRSRRRGRHGPLMPPDTTVVSVSGHRRWDSRGRPTVEVVVSTGSGSGRAIAPAGASTGSGEALDRRDGGSRFGGFGVEDAVQAVNAVIAPALVGLDARDQTACDAAMESLDGSPQFDSLGGNAVVATSLAVAHAAAAAAGVP